MRLAVSILIDINEDWITGNRYLSVKSEMISLDTVADLQQYRDTTTMINDDEFEKKISRWFKIFIKEGRKKYQASSKETQELFDNYYCPLTPFLEKCEISFFHLTQPIQYQFVYIHTPFYYAKIRDKKISIITPHWSSFLNSLNTMNFDISLEFKTIKEFFKFIIEHEFFNSNTVFYSPEYSNCFFIKGTITDFDPIEMIDWCFNQLSTYENHKNFELDEAISIGLQYHTRGKNKIWIGEVPNDFSFEDYIFRTPLPSKKVIHRSVENRDILVYSDCEISFHNYENHHAINITNLCLCQLLWAGYHFSPIYESSITKTSYEKDSQEIIFPHDLWIFQESAIKIPTYGSIQGTKEIPIETFENILENSIELSKNSELTEKIKIYFEAEEFYAKRNYSQSFVLSWILLEKYIHKKWSAHLTKKCVVGDKRRRDKLKKSWTADVIIETMNLSDQIDNKDYLELIELKSIRNNFVHGAKVIDKKQCDRVLEFALKLLKQEIKPVIPHKIMIKNRETFL